MELYTKNYSNGVRLILQARAVTYSERSRNLSWSWKSEWMFPEKKRHSKQESTVCIKGYIMACVSTLS